jgi:hypothetical protein
MNRRQDHRNTTPTTRTGSIDRRTRRGTQCTPTSASRARRGTARAVYGALAQLRRAIRSVEYIQKTCTTKYVSGGAGKRKEPRQCRPEYGRAPERRGLERALCNRVALSTRINGACCTPTTSATSVATPSALALALGRR